MLDKIVISKDRKTGVIHFDTHSVTLYHSEAKVLDLIVILMSPNNNVSTWDGMVSSLEDTAIININDLERKVA
jgi:hypothetical protein